MGQIQLLPCLYLFSSFEFLLDMNTTMDIAWIQNFQPIDKTKYKFESDLDIKQILLVMTTLLKEKLCQFTMSLPSKKCLLMRYEILNRYGSDTISIIHIHTIFLNGADTMSIFIKIQIQI